MAVHCTKGQLLALGVAIVSLARGKVARIRKPACSNCNFGSLNSVSRGFTHRKSKATLETEPHDPYVKRASDFESADLEIAPVRFVSLQNGPNVTNQESPTQGSSDEIEPTPSAEK
jgi:hypothetical protein